MALSVLIVDDSKSQLSLLEAELRSIGVINVVTAKNGQEALAFIEAQPFRFQLIITDLRMPVLDGMQLIEALSDTEYCGGVAIYSALEMRVVELAINLARRSHVHLLGNLTKPFNSADLEALLKKAEYLSTKVYSGSAYSRQQEILHALENGHVKPYFQPQVDANTMAIKGLEILCRIHVDGETDVLSPVYFMSIVEKHGLVDLLTIKVLEQALKEYDQYREEINNSERLELGINILPQQLDNGQLPEMLSAICNLNGFNGENLVVEITEGQALDTTKKISTLERLRIAGFGVSLDDFGTGFTNMGQIRQYPFTEIKMDRSMIHNIHHDRVSQVILNTMIELSRSYPLKIVAEGVETEDEYEYLREQGNVCIQGFLLSRPKPMNEMVRWMAIWNKQMGVKSTQKQKNITCNEPPPDQWSI